MIRPGEIKCCLSQLFFGLFFLFCFEPTSTVPSPHCLVGDFVVLAMGAHNRPSGCLPAVPHHPFVFVLASDDIVTRCGIVA